MSEGPAPQVEMEWVDAVREQFAAVIVGQRALLGRLLTALITGNHVLIEGVPGLGKTLSILTIARCFDASFHRIQCTPDLLPSDITGTLIYDAAVLALALLAMPVASFAQTVEEWFGKGVKALEGRQYQDAVHYFAEAARLSPGVPEIRFNLGKALYGFQFYNEAAGNFEMAASSARDVQLKARCKLGQGNALFRDAEQLPGTQAVERMKDAIAAYKDAQALNPQLVDAEYNRKVAERRLREKVLQAFPPGRAPSPVAAEPDAERVLKEMRRPVTAGTRAKDRGVERDW